MANRAKGRGCPYCSGKKILSGYNDLATTNPNLATEWHPDKNGVLLPTMVSPGSHKKVWWLCKKGHEWQASIENRSKGSSCPICRKSISKRKT
ncbi:MAG: zinc-ribbon domain-containing protein [Oscillospiraceae bacterium]|nr:zinc-ribbon domain-containing protein [Oscillospiraceae bacterium]